MSACEIVYLGPPGTFTFEVARKRFGRSGHKFVSEETVGGVCRHVAAKRASKGIVPIDNSSGGTIYPSVDALLDEGLGLNIEEELSLDVKLALLGKRGATIRKIYTHFAPKAHCKEWLDATYPNAELIETSSTSAAAREASRDVNSAAISNRAAAAVYHLDVLKHPIPTSIEVNVTHFFVITRGRTKQPRASKTSLAVWLKNSPGSLCGFLKPLSDARINLSRIISRPIEGKPREFAFLIDVDQSIGRRSLANALDDAKKHAVRLRILGSYPCFRTYASA